MNWFGESWDAPINDPTEHVETPVGIECGHCEERIVAGDRGVYVNGYASPLHFECFMRGIVGSVGHQRGTCPCHGGTDGDPDGMTVRQAARAALDYFYDHPPHAGKEVEAAARALLVKAIRRHRNN